MKLYSITPENVYPDASLRIVPNHEDRAVIAVSNHMGNTEYYPLETEGWKTDGSVLLSPCMGFDPEIFDEKSAETRRWVEKWSYPVEVAKAIIAQINHK
jgi:hypothetical protein